MTSSLWGRLDHNKQKERSLGDGKEPPLLRPGGWYDQGLRGRRRIQVSYDQTSETAATVIIEDFYENLQNNATEFTWRWHTAAGPISVHNNTFTITDPQGNRLIGTLLSEPEQQFQHDNNQVWL